MAINKVVYGTTVLVDLTSDTVDAAHLAKGYTAHDAGGNLIVGSLEPQADSNLLRGVTPNLLNGATQSGKAYVIPAGGTYGTDYIEYQLDIPALTSDKVYCLLTYGNTQANYRQLLAELHFDDSVSEGSSTLFFTSSPSVKAASFNLTSGAKPTKLVLKNASSNNQNPLSLFNIKLVMLNV